VSTEGDRISLPALVQSGVEMLCKEEAQRRSLPTVTVDRVQHAAFNAEIAEADRVAAEQAVAAVLMRQVHSSNWWQQTIHGKDTALALARAIAVADALANRSEGSPDAKRDGNQALLQLRRCIKGLLRSEVTSYCGVLKTILDPPIPKKTSWHARTRRLAVEAPLNVWNITITALGFLGVWLGPQSDEIAFDPDPWWVPESQDPHDKTPDAWASLLTAYASQFGSYTTLLWQVPALSLTAQAFLMTIALGSDSSNLARLIASWLSMIISVASSQLMHDQRGHAMNQGELALRVSKKLQLERDIGRLQLEDARPKKVDAETVWVAVDHRIYHVWSRCLFLFFVADLIIIAFVIVSWATGQRFGYPLGGIVVS
jgi:hypothetical protein